jgi:methyltransferase family protein
MSKPTLNVGCGPDSWGNVRLDVDFHTQTGAKSMLNLRADAQYLPFVDKAFSLVRCWHVLEHIASPSLAVNEIKRVGESGNIRFPVDDGFKRELLRNFVALTSYKQRRTALQGIRLAVRTRKLGAHLWIIRPVGARAQVNSYELFPFLLNGRKAKFFRKLRLPKIRYEWEIAL